MHQRPLDVLDAIFVSYVQELVLFVFCERLHFHLFLTPALFLYFLTELLPSMFKWIVHTDSRKTGPLMFSLPNWAPQNDGLNLPELTRGAFAIQENAEINF